MKNWIWIIIGVVGLAILLILASGHEEVPHAIIIADSVDFSNKGGGDVGASTPELDYEAKSFKKQPSEAFMGKKFALCLQMVHEWPDAEIYEIAHPHEGIGKIDCRVNRRHHELSFLDDICVSDVIIKK